MPVNLTDTAYNLPDDIYSCGVCKSIARSCYKRKKNLPREKPRGKKGNFGVAFCHWEKFAFCQEHKLVLLFECSDNKFGKHCSHCCEIFPSIERVDCIGPSGSEISFCREDYWKLVREA